MRLAGLDGCEGARQVRAGPGGRVFLIAQAAYDKQHVGRRVRDAGFDAHLVKPVTLKEFERRLGVAAAR